MFQADPPHLNGSHDFTHWTRLKQFSCDLRRIFLGNFIRKLRMEESFRKIERPFSNSNLSRSASTFSSGTGWWCRVLMQRFTESFYGFSVNLTFCFIVASWERGVFNWLFEQSCFAVVRVVSRARIFFWHPPFQLSVVYVLFLLEN